jgi:hypothetical protein
MKVTFEACNGGSERRVYLCKVDHDGPEMTS